MLDDGNDEEATPTAHKPPFLSKNIVCCSLAMTVVMSALSTRASTLSGRGLSISIAPCPRAWPLPNVRASPLWRLTALCWDPAEMVVTGSCSSWAMVWGRKMMGVKVPFPHWPSKFLPLCGEKEEEEGRI